MEGRTDEERRPVPPPPPLARHERPPVEEAPIPPPPGAPGGAPLPGPGPSAPPPSAPPPWQGVQHTRGPNMWLIVAMVMVAVLAIVAGFAILVSGDDSSGPATTVAPARTTVSVPVTPVAPTAATLPTVVPTGVTPTSTGGGGTAEYTLEREPTTFDPADPRFVDDALARVFYESLFWYDPTIGEVVPSLVERYEVERTADQAIWTLRLHAGVMFHDGSRFDADTVVANLARQSAASWPALAALVSTSVVDDLTVELVFGPAALDQAPVLALLSGPVGIMVSSVEWDLSSTPVGTGPFVLERWDRGDRIVARRFDEYWRGALPTEWIVFTID